MAPSRVLVLFVFACSTALAGVHAHAQEPQAAQATQPAPDANARALAAAHWKRGVEHASKRAYAEALTEFESAYALVRHAAALYNIALAQVGLARTAAAIATLRTYLADPVATQNAAQRRAAQALLDQQLAKLAAQAAAPVGASATLTVIVFPYGPVWLDGEPVGSSPVTRNVTPGPHSITGGRERPDLSAEVVLEPGATERVVLPWARADLVSAAAAPGSTSH